MTHLWKIRLESRLSVTPRMFSLTYYSLPMKVRTLTLMSVCRFLSRRNVNYFFLERKITTELKILLASRMLNGFPGRLSSKESTRPCRRRGLDPSAGRVPWRRKWQPPPVFLPAKFHGQRSLVGHSPRGCRESDVTQQPNNNKGHGTMYESSISSFRKGL